MFSIANRYGSINQLRHDVINSHCLWLMSFVSIQNLQESKSTQIKRPWHQIEFLNFTFLLRRLNLYYVGEWKIVHCRKRVKEKLKLKLRKSVPIDNGSMSNMFDDKICHFSFFLFCFLIFYQNKIFCIIYWWNLKSKQKREERISWTDKVGNNVQLIANLKARRKGKTLRQFNRRFTDNNYFNFTFLPLNLTANLS